MNACLERLALGLAGVGLLAACAHRAPNAPDPRPAAPPPPQAAVPEGARADFRAAIDALRAGRTGEAIPRLQALTEKAPDLAGPWFNLGLARLAAGDPAAALTALENAARLRPRDARVHNARGVALRRLGRLQAAQAAYRRALELDPDLASAHRNLGILYDLYLDRPGEAVRHYRRYRDLDPRAAAEVDRWLRELARRPRRAGAGEGGG